MFLNRKKWREASLTLHSKVAGSLWSSGKLFLDCAKSTLYLLFIVERSCTAPCTLVPSGVSYTHCTHRLYFSILSHGLLFLCSCCRNHSAPLWVHLVSLPQLKESSKKHPWGASVKQLAKLSKRRFLAHSSPLKKFKQGIKALTAASLCVRGPEKLCSWLTKPGFGFDTHFAWFFLTHQMKSVSQKASKQGDCLIFTEDHR